MLTATQQLSREITLLVRDTRADLKPTLDQLARVTAVLAKNQKAIDAALERAPMYYRAFTESTGSGPWLNGYIGGFCEAVGAPYLTDSGVCS